MAITWIDTPNDPTVELAASAPVRFATDRDCDYINVWLGNGIAEECAYRNGAFRDRYTSSSVDEGEDGFTWTIRRHGGFPLDPAFAVKEQSAPVALPTTFWETIYERDLRTLPNQTLNANADQTIDGLTWWTHYSSGNGDSVAVVNGLGVRLRGSQPPTSGNNYAGAYAGIAVYLMPQYDPTKRVAVQFRFADGDVTNQSLRQIGTRMFSTSVMGFGSPAGAATTQRVILGSNVSDAQFWSSNFTLDYGRQVRELPKGGVATAPHTWAFAVTADPWKGVNDYQWRTHLFKSQLDSYEPPLPRIEDMQVFGSTGDTGTGENANYRIGAWVAGPNASTQRTAYITHVRVLQMAA